MAAPIPLRSGTSHTGSCRGRAGAGEPVDADIGEELIAVDGIFRQIGGRVRPLLELLDDPGELTNRRVVQRVGKRLRSGGLDLQVALGIGLELLLQARHMVLLGGGETGGVDRDLVAEEDERRRVGVRVRADDVVRLGAGEHSGNAGPDITALSAVALITETAASARRRRLVMRGMSQPVSRTGTGNPKPGIDGATTWKASAGSPPWARGSVNGPMISMNSAIEPG